MIFQQTLIELFSTHLMGGQGNAKKPRPKIDGSQNRNRDDKDRSRRKPYIPKPPKPPKPKGNKR